MSDHLPPFGTHRNGGGAGSEPPFSALIERLLKTRSTLSDEALGDDLVLTALWRKLHLAQAIPKLRGRVMRRLLAEVIESHSRRRTACPICELWPQADDLRVLNLLVKWEVRGSFTQRIPALQAVTLSDFKAHLERQSSLEHSAGQKRTAPFVPRNAVAKTHLDEITKRTDWKLVLDLCPTHDYGGKLRGYARGTFHKRRSAAISALAHHFAGADDVYLIDRLSALIIEEGQRSRIPRSRTSRNTTAQPDHSTPATTPQAAGKPPTQWHNHGIRRRPRPSITLAGRRTLPIAPAPPTVAPHTHAQPRQPLRRTLVRAAMPALAVLGMLFVALTGPAARSISLAAADVDGWLVVRQSQQGQVRSLEILDPRTGAARELWSPTRQASQGESELTSFANPAFAPRTHTLAIVANGPAISNSLWVMLLTTGANGWPIAGPLRDVLPDCGTCDTITWSPSGRYLIFKGSDGLHALDVNTGTNQRLTNAPGDAWPACSPDGTQLAYQNIFQGISVLPTVDCIPIANAINSERYLVGYIPAWHEEWSPDSRTLAFMSTVNSTGAASIYTVLSADLDSQSDGETTPTQKRSDNNCGNPIWATRNHAQSTVVIYKCGDLQIVISSYATHAAWIATLNTAPLIDDSLTWIA